MTGSAPERLGALSTLSHQPNDAGRTQHRRLFPQMRIFLAQRQATFRARRSSGASRRPPSRASGAAMTAPTAANRRRWSRNATAKMSCTGSRNALARTGRPGKLRRKPGPGRRPFPRRRIQTGVGIRPPIGARAARRDPGALAGGGGVHQVVAGRTRRRIRRDSVCDRFRAQAECDRHGDADARDRPLVEGVRLLHQVDRYR